MNEQYVVGRNPVLELLKSDRQIDKLYVLKGELHGSINKILGMAKANNIIVQQVDKKKLDSISEGNAHQGVAALVTGFEYSTIDDILEKANSMNQKPFVVILDGIEDTHNLGSIVRTAECAGVHGIIIPKRRSAMVNQTVYKSSAGAVEHMLVANVNNISNAIDELKQQGLWIYGADMDGENFHFNTSMTGAVALVIGNEGKGLTRLVKEKCDVLVKIPMVGRISSLNAANAASILIYEVLRQGYEKEK
ncbi:23S rRNA (guanosine(2251)-2'-O)-methyltransferase RlmB [Tissierella sp. Yu-01]|uniref:23S rRNA (guanosine(2251)-2'-O)-methyltransferase RlmB n=1 Tax=Tissierella sp. Yu-01 TaxID=3035694 RepID=UPI00240D6269|nr:23S rRNA (guanosine(2251)-2'-O)-methyltransferase RlmB [Tissierella sp. Yu-01]WFA07676.1 23S rRNA (guanosine(2251)-2'-O)-methyltransferase RlmB [Tissierella sp. Yu-01]